MSTGTVTWAAVSVPFSDETTLVHPRPANYRGSTCPWEESSMSADAGRLVFDFTEGSREQVDLLGGKGANLAEMTRLGLPVPPGFTITTDACRHYLARGEE